MYLSCITGQVGSGSNAAIAVAASRAIGATLEVLMDRAHLHMCLSVCLSVINRTDLKAHYSICLAFGWMSRFTLVNRLVSQSITVDG